MTEGLETYRWESRPLLVFAPGEDDDAFTEQLARLEANMAGLKDRDMAVALVTGSADEPRMLTGKAPGVDATRLRADYSVPAEAFAVVLVGKDGGEKDRWTTPVDPAEIFAEIDAMPMRRREMREGG